MNYQDLGKAFKAKNPAYSTRDDEDLGRAVAKKYPQYQKMVTAEPPSPLQKVAQVATTPFRGYRGIGVGVQNLLAGQGPSQALERASAATQPGFKPHSFMEGLVGGAAEAAPLLPLASLGAGAGLVGGLTQAGTQGAIGAGYSALSQESEKGKVSPGETAFAGLLSGGIPAVAKGAKALYPKIAAHFTKTPIEAMERAAQEGEQFIGKGTKEAVDSQANKVLAAFRGAKDQFKKKFDVIKESLGINPTDNEVSIEYQKTKGEPRTLDVIDDELKEIKAKSGPYTTKKELPLTDSRGNKIKMDVQEKGLPENERLRRLLRLDQDLNNKTGGSFDDYSYKLKNGIQEEMRKIPGAEDLLGLRKNYSGFKKIEEILGKDMADPERASTVAQKIVNRDIKGTLTGGDSEKASAIKELEKMTGKDVFEPLRDSILASTLHPWMGPFAPKGLIGKAILLTRPDLALKEAALSSPRLLASMAKPFAASMRNLAKSGLPASTAISALMKRREDE